QVYVFLTPDAAGATASTSYIADTGMKGEFRISVTVPPLKGNEYKISAVGSFTSRTVEAVLLGCAKLSAEPPSAPTFSTPRGDALKPRIARYPASRRAGRATVSTRVRRRTAGGRGREDAE